MPKAVHDNRGGRQGLSKSQNDAIIGEALSQGDVHPFFFVRTSKFSPSLVVLKFLHNLSSAVLIFKSTHKNNNSKK